MKKDSNVTFDYAIHSDFLIHWTGRDIDDKYHEKWDESESGKSETDKKCTDLYVERIHNILKYGLWMTEKQEGSICFDGTSVSIPKTPSTCFTELKLSESRKHARLYGRLGIGVKRHFLFDRWGRPLIYYLREKLEKDIFLKTCASALNRVDKDENEIKKKSLLNFFKPMNSSDTLKNYDLYSESEWRIIYFKELLSEIVSKNSDNTNERMAIIDPRNCKNKKEHAYFNNLTCEEKKKLKYLIPLDGWLAMIIYPSLNVKNEAQKYIKENKKDGEIKYKLNDIQKEIKRIKNIPNVEGKKIEGGNWPIEVDLDACRNF